MQNTEQVRNILSWYPSDNPGTLSNLARLMNTGRLAGTGKFVILPVDQGFEHGPIRSFQPNPAGYDPNYHYQLALEAGCNAYAAPLGALEAVAGKYCGEVPLILKLNNSDGMYSDGDPIPAITGSVEDALRLGCSAIGFTIYPGSANRNTMYEEIRELILDAKSVGIPTVIWAYPRGSGLSKAGETAIDIVAYAAHVAAQLGAHIVKVKPPTAHVEMEANKKMIEKHGIEIGTLADRIRYVRQATFDGRRIVIFSGGEAKGTDALMDEIRQIRDGGGMGSIMGRNAFQRPKEEAIKLLQDIMDIYAGKA